MEYRSTSNYIFSSEELMRWAYKQTMLAVDFVNKNIKDLSILDQYGSIIISAINDLESYKAAGLIDKFKIEVLKTVLQEK